MWTIFFLSTYKAWQEGGLPWGTSLRSIIINQDFYESKPRGHMPSLLGSASEEEGILKRVSEAIMKQIWLIHEKKLLKTKIVPKFEKKSVSKSKSAMSYP